MSIRISGSHERYSPSLYYVLLTNSGEPTLQNKWGYKLKEKDGGRKKTLQNKWGYKSKEKDEGRKRYKDRLVVKGFAQKKGI